MAKKSQLKSSTKTIESLAHNEAKRKNIPTAEYQSVIQKEEEKPKTIRYPRNTDLDPQLVWRGKDEQDWSDLVVHAPPLYIQEKVHPKVLIDDLLRQTREQRDQEAGAQTDLFADFNGIPAGVDKTEFYQHDQNWSNRMILGDSLQVMASLAEREGLRGKVQCIYLDPPYGIKFNSNFQWSTTSRDVKDGNAGHITREPEQVKAFRDTWRDGIHSYLTYLRDRLTVARDLLTDSGSIFVQIGDENVHRVRAVMDEVFGESNFLSTISVQKTSYATADFLPNLFDQILCYAKSLEVVKYRKLYNDRAFEDTDDFESRDLASAGAGASTYDFEFEGHPFHPGANRHWKTQVNGLRRAVKADRLFRSTNSLRYKRFNRDFPVTEIHNTWTDTMVGSFHEPRRYVVETSPKVVARCLLMATDPGDLVLDPTCGSGTTATVAEQWGRRWITIDTSRVALALARARIMGARYPFYLLADSREGQLKEAEVTRTAPSSQPVHGNIRHGFVYERVPHITLKSIADNAEIDVIWDKWQETLEPLHEKLNAGTVQRADLVAAAREAGDAGFDVLITCAFNYEAHTTEFRNLGRIPVLKARMNADLHMAEDLKNTGKGNLFVIFGEPDIELIPEKDGKLRVKVKGVDVFKPQTGEVVSNGPDEIACWFIDTDYNEESFFVRHAYFLGANDPYSALKTTLKAEINEEAWATLNSDTSRPFDKPKNGRIAVKVINHLGDEVMKVFRV